MTILKKIDCKELQWMAFRFSDVKAGSKNYLHFAMDFNGKKVFLDFNNDEEVVRINSYNKNSAQEKQNIINQVKKILSLFENYPIKYARKRFEEIKKILPKKLDQELKIILEDLERTLVVYKTDPRAPSDFSYSLRRFHKGFRKDRDFFKVYKLRSKIEDDFYNASKNYK